MCWIIIEHFIDHFLDIIPPHCYHLLEAEVQLKHLNDMALNLDRAYIIPGLTKAPPLLSYVKGACI